MATTIDAIVIKQARPLCALLLAAAAWVVSGPAAAGGPASRTPAELKAQLETIMREERVPGIGLAVVANGQLVWQAGLGLADPAGKTPASAQTLFRVGDIAKGFVGLAALKLQEQGKLKLTDTLKQWAPELALDNHWEASDPVRLAHLLEHTSGLSDMSLMEYAHSAEPPVSLKQALQLNGGGRKARWRPGSRAAHSSVGPALVAYVIEKVSGQRFEDYVTQNFFLPMGMKSASYVEPHSGFAGQYAADGVTALPYWHHLYRPSGALNASAEDMAQYLLLLVNRGSVGGTQIVSPASVERLERPETLAMVALGIKVAPGAGMLNTIENGVHFRGHFGIVNGGLSEVLYLPETRSGVVLMMNSLNELARARVLELLQTYLVQGVPRPAAAPVASVDAELREHYQGYYLEDSPASERMRFVHDFTDVMQVVFTDNGMIARNVFSGYAEEWIAQTGRTFRQQGQAEPMVAMFRAQDGEIVMQSKWGTLRKVSTFRALAPLAVGALSIFLMLSSLIAGAVWAVKKLFWRDPAAVATSIRLLPMVASMLFFMIGFTLVGAMNLQGLWGGWGAPTAESIAALVVGIAFLVLSVMGVVNLVRQRRPATGRFVYWHSALVSVACLTVALYLLYWQAIGIPVWKM